MDVSVTMLLKLQQFVEYMEVPQLQFLDRVVVQLLHRDRYTVQTVQKSVEILQVQFLDWFGPPVVVQRQVRGSDGAENSGVPQVQYFDRVVDVPACSSSTRFGRSVILQRQVHADSGRCLRFSLCWIMMAVMGFLAHFAPFFALLRLSGVERQVSVEEPSIDEEFFVIEGWGGGADAGSFSQVSGHQLCITSS